jgi:signal transduction histidine kinase
VTAVPTPRHWARSFRLGFTTRLALATSALIVVVSIAQSWILAQRDQAHVRSYLTERGRTISEYLAREAGPSVLGGNLEALHQLAEQARAEKTVVYSRFFDRQGLLLVSVGRPAGSALPPRPAKAGEVVGPIAIGTDVWEFQAPVLAVDVPGHRRVATAGASARLGAVPGEPAATVAIGISLESLEALRRRTFTAATFSTALFNLLAVLGAVLLARAITRPLHALATAADTIARGDFNARVKVSSGGDELGGLARSFNAMVESLARSRTALEEKVSELQTANRLKSEFLATISHELRTPLNVIIGYVEMLAEGGAGALTPQQAEMLGAIRRYSKLQFDLITNVLDFSRLASGKISFHVERFALAPMLTEVQALHGARMRNPRLGLVLTVDPAVPMLETDRIKLQEVVRNLVDNAVKFTEQGKVEVTARPGDAPGTVVIEVSDTGPGIRPEDLRYIFDPFHQVGESSTRRTGGVGLGLSIVKQLAEALGGSVSVSSRVGEGSTFRVELPCRLPQATTEPVPARAADAVAALDDVTRNVATVPDARVRRSPSRLRTATERRPK